MQERQEELESNNKRLQQEEQDLREKYHEVWISRYNLGQKLLKPITKYLFFALVLTKKLTVAKWKTVVTPEMHTWAFRPNNFEQGLLGGGATLFPLEMIVLGREITKHMEMSNELCPGL